MSGRKTDAILVDKTRYERMMKQLFNTLDKNIVEFRKYQHTLEQYHSEGNKRACRETMSMVIGR